MEAYEGVLQVPEKQLSEQRRGPHISVHTGINMGGGAKVSNLSISLYTLLILSNQKAGNLVITNVIHAAAVASLLADSDFIRIAGFGTSKL